MTVEIVVDQLRRRVPGGIGTYARGLLQGLTAIHQPDVTLLAGRGPDLHLGYPLRTSPLPSRVLTRAWDRGLCGRAHGDVVHAVSTAAPYPRGTPVVVVVHDTAWRSFPDAYPPRGRRWHEAALQRAMARAAAIVTPSDIGLDRQVVIPEGSDHLPPPDADATRRLLDDLGVTTPYLLTVSTLEPRKNLVRLMDAYQRALSALPERWPLVVAGAAGWGPSVAPVPGVTLAGPVPPAVLAALYAGARCLVYVPLLEGWGLPPVEAMRAGTPVVASPMPSTGGAALEVDPRDVDAIAAALLTAAGDEAVRSELVAAGRERTRDLTWATTARRHVDLWWELA